MSDLQLKWTHKETWSEDQRGHHPDSGSSMFSWFQSSVLMMYWFQCGFSYMYLLDKALTSNVRRRRSLLQSKTPDQFKTGTFTCNRVFLQLLVVLLKKEIFSTLSVFTPCPQLTELTVAIATRHLQQTGCSGTRDLGPAQTCAEHRRVRTRSWTFTSSHLLQHTRAGIS